LASYTSDFKKHDFYGILFSFRHKPFEFFESPYSLDQQMRLLGSEHQAYMAQLIFRRLVKAFGSNGSLMTARQMFCFRAQIPGKPLK
jgi:hypothetical protein